MDGKQITMLDDIDRLDETHYQMKVAEIRGKLEKEYHQRLFPIFLNLIFLPKVKTEQV